MADSDVTCSDEEPDGGEPDWFESSLLSADQTLTSRVQQHEKNTAHTVRRRTCAECGELADALKRAAPDHERTAACVLLDGATTVQGMGGCPLCRTKRRLGKLGRLS